MRANLTSYYVGAMICQPYISLAWLEHMPDHHGILIIGYSIELFMVYMLV